MNFDFIATKAIEPTLSYASCVRGNVIFFDTEPYGIHEVS